MGEDHPRPSVPDGQARHPAPRSRVRRLQRPGLGCRCRGQSSRRRARDVTAPHARAHRMEHRGRTPRSDGVQHPGRVPRRRDRARGAEGGARHRCRQVARAAHLRACRRRDRALRRPSRERRRQGRGRRGGKGSGDPELRGHRVDHAPASREQLPPRARHRRQDRGDVRRQHRHVAVARADARCRDCTRATIPRSCS